MFGNTCIDLLVKITYRLHVCELEFEYVGHKRLFNEGEK